MADGFDESSNGEVGDVGKYPRIWEGAVEIFPRKRSTTLHQSRRCGVRTSHWKSFRQGTCFFGPREVAIIHAMNQLGDMVATAPPPIPRLKLSGQLSVSAVSLTIALFTLQ